ncbi:hypothetical protein HDV62DRAFT_355315 [Trichoderma sp. SZMC 28011]
MNVLRMILTVYFCLSECRILTTIPPPQCAMHRTLTRNLLTLGLFKNIYQGAYSWLQQLKSLVRSAEALPVG